MTKVSVIVPIYNVDKVIARSVQSLMAQTLKDFEVIFVDDCCKDNSLAELNRALESCKREDVEVKVISHTQNQGAAAARNTGLDNAQGEYIYFLDADDYCEANALQVMYDRAQEQTAILSAASGT